MAVPSNPTEAAENYAEIVANHTGLETWSNGAQACFDLSGEEPLSHVTFSREIVGGTDAYYERGLRTKTRWEAKEPPVRENGEDILVLEFVVDS